MTDQAVANPFTLDIERKADSIVVVCHGRLVAGLCDALHARVKPLLAQSKMVVLDLGDVTFMDSMGLGTMVRLLVSARSAGCDLELLHVGRRIREVLGLTHLLQVFTIIGEGMPGPRF
jgi:anti-sigma B factor antagonist